MLGLMQDQPLLISSLMVHADRFHGDTEIVSRRHEGGIHRTTYHQIHARTRRLAKALRRLGVGEGDRIATLAWNTDRHFEIYFAAPGMGAVCHTINPRLFRDQILYIINHAEDAFVFFDLSFAALVEALKPQCPLVKGWVALAARGAEAPAGSLFYEDLIDAEKDDFTWPVLDERMASSLCYTSGTTGNPKGVLYSHRSNVLHTYGSALPDSMNLSAKDVVLPIVPMFHANAWGLPYMCCAVGAKLVMPGAALDGKSLYELFDAERVTFSAGVPTVWLGLVQYLRETGHTLPAMKRTIIGGSACPAALKHALEKDYGIEVRHAWGMTETSPLGSVAQLKGKHATLDAEARDLLTQTQGRPSFGIDIKIVDAEGQALPWDGTVFGDLLVKGSWVTSAYFKADGGSPLRDGWFPTGDVATIDPDGFIKITDRSKDVIKSGGEWISSIELENIAVAHPAVAEAAVIGVKHPKWAERPLLVVQRKAGATLQRDELLAFYGDKVAKWWIPDDVVFVETLPHTATGKLLKTKLRSDYADYRLPES